MQSGLGDHAHRLAQPDHQRLPGLVDREQRAIGDDQRHDDEGSDDAAGEIEPHRPPPKDTYAVAVFDGTAKPMTPPARAGEPTGSMGKPKQCRVLQIVPIKTSPAGAAEARWP
jgi:hypothetical protein